MGCAPCTNVCMQNSDSEAEVPFMVTGEPPKGYVAMQIHSWLIITIYCLHAHFVIADITSGLKSCIIFCTSHTLTTLHYALFSVFR